MTDASKHDEALLNSAGFWRRRWFRHHPPSSQLWSIATCYDDLVTTFWIARESKRGPKPEENRESHEKTFQYKSRQEALLDEELIEDKLAQLLASIDQLERTPAGAAGIQRRVKILGECKGAKVKLLRNFTPG